MKGFVVYCGIDPTLGGSFRYFLDLKEAEAYAIKECAFWSENTGKKWISKIENIELKKCATPWCNDLVPEDQDVCLGCEDLIEDARWEYEDDLEV